MAKKIIMSLLGCLSLAYLAVAAPSPDAIGVRIATNPKHYSAANWYRSQGFKGSPQSLLVDGYEAIRDGRTVYIDVANVVEVAPANNELSIGDQFFTNIFIISYNQDADKSTEDIFGQVLANWKFNNNLLKVGSCLDEPADLCVYASSCGVGDYCVSSHDVSVRDTKRLADLMSMNELLASYKAAHNGFCPTLSSGSYLPNKSVSTWPSWQEELGRSLGASLPSDPINRMGACAGYNAKTCWSEQTKKFAGTSMPASITLPSGSHAYTYYSSPDGRTCGFYAATESKLDCNINGVCTVGVNVSVSLDFSPARPNRGPVVTCGNMVGLPHTPFSKFVSANDPDPGDNNHLSWVIDTSITPVWTNWSAAPVIKKTSVINQKEIFAASSGDKGNYSFSVTVSDDRGSSTVKTCNIGLGTTLPQILPIANQSVYSGEEMNALTVYASEPEKDYPLNFMFTGDNLTTGATVNNIFTCSSVSPVFGDASGRFNCMLNRQAVNQAGGDYQITVKATDKSGDSNTVTYMLKVINNPPAITANSFVWEASTTAPLNQLIWGAVDLQSNLPIAFSNLPALPGGIAVSTTVADRPNTTVAYAYGSVITNSSVGVKALQYSANGSLSNANVFNAAATTINFTAGATDVFGANSTTPYSIRINNNAPVVGPIGCANVTRHSSPYSCTIPVTDANANAISSHIASGLPAGLSSALAGNAITISGSPFYVDVGSHNITVDATDEFGYTGPNATYALDVVTYCGDNHLQNPNGEGGAESCDISVGIAANPASSLPTKQYACSPACTQTGGWCGNNNIDAGSTESCDDGNLANIDGCNSVCTPEVNWTCVGNPSVCTPNVQVAACDPKPANSVWNNSNVITQTWTGFAWFPGTATTYNDATPAPCRFKCASGYSWDGTSCVLSCGNGMADAGENAANCPADCKTCSFEGTNGAVGGYTNIEGGFGNCGNKCACPAGTTMSHTDNIACATLLTSGCDANSCWAFRSPCSGCGGGGGQRMVCQINNYATQCLSSCPALSCGPTGNCPDGSPPIYLAAKSGYFCGTTVYSWSKVLDHTIDIHFHSNGTISYSNESMHGALSANPGYAYPFTFTASDIFPLSGAAYYGLSISGSSTCQPNGASTINATEIVIPILEPAGGENACTAVIQRFDPAY